MQLWKEVLLPGRQRDRFGNWFTVKPKAVREAARNVSKMLSRGVPLPTVWEHQDVEAGDTAAQKAAYAKHTFGHIAGQRINARGALELLHEVRDQGDAAQLLKTRYVSPKLYRGYSDSRGGEYRGTTIAHVAATPTPVQYWQRPFEMSRGQALYLSYTPGDAMADEKDDGDKGGKSDDKPKPSGGGGKSTLADVIAALKEKGWNIPDEVQDEAGLVIAIKAGDGMGDDDSDIDLGDPNTPPGDTAAASGAPMLMSDARAALAKSTRSEYEARERACFAAGKIDRPTALQTIRELRAIPMSFTRDGELVPNRIAIRIEEHERLKDGAAWSKDGRRPGDSLELSNTRVEAAPEKLGGPPDSKVIDFMCAGLPAKK